ncbi:TIGR03668 family PPOX class F420-dependent oxidoreductase [Streptacidiphilus jiangxiensis]|uniref:PPOX class probable F420-dependent enzyme, Rv0121 family n=1 Tax=Streptacidiphilus jiangxiensis TaxID=235985 RepID=A0A1H8AEN7_STRJI|nr:TIGR03668 family PPOX class F420-dependent oxidoreductase [Streptacidiphilus jiangxiensis]SEM69312.1 PPOX class probable F420-dependent enzyme, Rv0121 family [Streptacidiphilus jiangxiensis]SEM75992.1 PPOX class probable F420-dependent enzyme, Rv0121 family [Streptacidiphilus jiangxiensis]
MNLTSEQARERLVAARAVRLATVSPAGQPHLVPITFAAEGSRLYFAVDHKPKSTTALRRLKNIRDNPRVSVLADFYDDDWTQLWWVRGDGDAEIWEEGPERERALDLLAAKYPQYAEARPAGAVVAITIDHISGWSYRD